MDEKIAEELSSNSRELVLKVTFPERSAGELFNYFTQPELLTTWWPQQATVEPWPGGQYVLSWPALEWVLRGVYTAFQPGERLAFTWNWDHEPTLPERHVDIAFREGEPGCDLLLTHGRYTSSQVDQDDRQSHLDGWQHFLGQLAAALS